MKLNLGCSSVHRAGFVNVDLVEPADVLADLNLRWPWEDSSAEFVLGVDIIEHLEKRIHTLNELWRVMRPGGLAELEVPVAGSECSFADPTHVSFWNRTAFFYCEQGHPYRAQYAKAYGIVACFEVVECYTRTMREGPKLLIKLKAVKGEM